MMNKERLGWFSKIALVLGSVAEIALITAMIFFGLKWFGNLLEAMCSYVNIGMGISMICIIVIGFIYIDNKNSIEEYEEHQREQRFKKTQSHQKNT